MGRIHLVPSPQAGEKLDEVFVFVCAIGLLDDVEPEEIKAVAKAEQLPLPLGLIRLPVYVGLVRRVADPVGKPVGVSGIPTAARV